MWEHGKGERWTPEQLLKDIQATPDVDGISLTGGEPLDQYSEVLTFLKLAFPLYNVFLTSGYTYRTILEYFPLVLNCIDILVDGPFVKELLDETPAWRGSTNQTIRFLTERSKKYENYKSEFGAEVIVSKDKITMTGFGIPKTVEQGLK
jgi:anaerobic ribonucleoside-triphosphate reductase activating protein